MHLILIAGNENLKDIGEIMFYIHVLVFHKIV